MSPRQPSHSQPAHPTFLPTSSYKLIYVYAIDDKPHEGYLKVGETTVHSPLEPDDLPPNCDILNEAARARIDCETQTAGVDYRLLYTELAVRSRTFSNGHIRDESFSDKKVQNVLKDSGIPHKYIGNTKGREWYGTDLKTVKNAIAAVKAYRAVLSGGAIEPEEPIVLRDEQKDAIAKTLERFKSHSDMLWDAKMRFGKTLAALQLVREAKGRYRRVVIVTHRPVVGGGWQEDFQKLFDPADGYEFYVKNALKSAAGYEFNGRDETRNDKALAKLEASGAHFIYFASIQDLRGSQAVGGKYDKNRGVFDMDWDLVIVDEAHEGTQTILGKEVQQLLVKKHTKVLSLSGTPFNILPQYDDDAIFVWDYVMEQKRKETWETEHPDEPNPYARLPRLNLYTYDLGSQIEGYTEEDLEGKAFKFREFFRTWTGDRDLDHRPVPRDARVGDFVHAEDVRRFLDLISGDSSTSRYPFATPQHRDLFRHTLWIVPGVASAKALSALLRTHPYFKRYGIANVAGEGDDYEERHFDSALELVRKTIRENEYSITLSCGKLTTGVTVPEWTAVLMLSGGTAVSAAQYMQTIFRVQSPGDLGGRMKTNCYAFDFAPDRALKVIAETVQVSRRLSKSSADDEHGRRALGEFLNYCPVISISGTRMESYDVRRMMASIKHIFVTKTIRNGFDDASLYSPRLLELEDIDLKKFEDLRKIVGTSKQTKAADTVYVNEQDFDDEQRAKGPKQPKRELTPEEKAAREELKRRREERKRAISILRAISIRMPLLIYGADVPIEKVISIAEFPDLVDDESWKEFMPRGVTKAIFKTFVEYYDPDVFAEAGTQIRKLAKSADQLPPTRRVQQIARIFSYFKNPDKETVLTPWRVVNMHLADTIGGWCFWDENYEKPLEDGPRHVLRPGVTQALFGKPDVRILEINSKSGLYPLYVAYSLYRRKLGDIAEDAIRPRELEKHWRQAVADSLFVVCKTPMARTITRRTLVGYTDAPVNTLYIENLVGLIQKSPHQFSIIVSSAKAWGKEARMKHLEFDAVVGNPPYQLEIAKKQSATNGQARRQSIFQYFQLAADAVSAGFISLIYPGGRWLHRSGKGMEEFGLAQINDPRLAKIDFYADYKDVFPTAEIADGLTIVFKDVHKTTPRFTYVYHKDGMAQSYELECPGKVLLPLNPCDNAILAKVRAFSQAKGLKPLANAILSQKFFAIESDFVEKNPHLVRLYDEKKALNRETEIKLLTNDKAGKAGRSRWYVVKRKVITANRDAIDKWKVVVSSANAGGQKRDWQLEVLDNHSAFGRSRVALKLFKTKSEAENFFRYCETYLIRFLFLMTDESLTSLAKEVPDLGEYKTAGGLLDYSKELNKQLYKLVGLTKSEIAYVEKTIQDIDASRNMKSNP
jgi:superfamily II DNA or RNA helicase